MEPRRKSQGCTVEIIMVVRRSMVTDVLPPLIGLGWRWKATTKQMVEEGLHLLLLEGITLSEDLSAHLMKQPFDGHSRFWSISSISRCAQWAQCPCPTWLDEHSSLKLLWKWLFSSFFPVIRIIIMFLEDKRNQSMSLLSGCKLSPTDAFWHALRHCYFVIGVKAICRRGDKSSNNLRNCFRKYILDCWQDLLCQNETFYFLNMM